MTSSRPSIIGIVLTTDQHKWIYTSQASAVFGGFIVVNAILLGIETDVVEEPSSIGAGWSAVDVCFTLIFAVECALRIEAERCKWYLDFWNLLDGLLVFLGFVDVALLIVGSAGETRILSAARLLRLLRITRLGKILGLFRYVKELLLLATSFWAAVRATLWAMLLFLLVILVAGLFVTRLVGQSCCGEEDLFQDRRYVEWFGTVPRTVFTLFTCATLESWPLYARASFNHMGLLLFLILFVMLANLMLLQVVAAIVIEYVMDRANMEEEAELRRLEDEQQARLVDLFNRLDTDDDRQLTITEIAAALAKSEVDRRGDAEMFEDEAERDITTALLEEALRHAKMSKYDAHELFRVLDMDDNGSLTMEEFTEGMAVAAIAPGALSAVQICVEAKALGNQLRRIIGALREIDEFLAHLRLRETASEHCQPILEAGLSRPASDATASRGPGRRPSPPVDPVPADDAPSMPSVPLTPRTDASSDQARRGAGVALLRAEMLQATANAEGRLRDKLQKEIVELRKELELAYEATERRLRSGTPPGPTVHV